MVTPDARDTILAQFVRKRYDVHDVYIEEGDMPGTAGKKKPSLALRHKHLKLDQRKINFAKRYFGVQSEQEAIDRALSLLLEEQKLLKALQPLKGFLKDDERPWPYR